jgi:hypothetical protein
MAKLVALKQVNTKTLPELEPIIGDIYDKDTQQGAYAHGPEGIFYRFGNNEIDLPGTYQFAGQQVIDGPIESITVRRSGEKAYEITEFDLNIEELWADASDNGKLDTVPREIFKGKDNAKGSPENDTIFTFGGRDRIEAGGGDDIVNGGDGNDIIAGGTGGDRLRGGFNTDTFLYKDLKHAKPGNPDRILDFNKMQGDEIDLERIDANPNKPGDQDFDFIGKSPFSGARGELRYKVKDGNAIVQADVNGDAKADLAIVVVGVTKLSGGDFEV